MNIQVADAAAARSAELVAVLLAKGRKAQLPGDAGRQAEALMRRKEWTPDWKSQLFLFGGDGARERLLLVGLGDEGQVDAERLRRAAAAALQRAQQAKVKSLGLVLEARGPAPAAAASAIAEGLALAAYRFEPRKKEKDPAPALRQVKIAAPGAPREWKAGVRRGVAVGESANVARALGDRPGNEMPPRKLAEEAKRLAREHRLRCRVYGVPELRRMKMGGILGVGKGSAEPPVLIEMEYAPKGYERTVCLVGKGLTFDTGGISIKPAAQMDEMKYDMCGGAAVLGTLAAAARLALPVRVIGIVPSAENMPGPDAQKPGDVLVTASGLTVEVLNTDAEGRLVLADGLHHARRFAPDWIVDVATLTGAIVVALGHDAAGLYSNDEALARRLEQAGREAGDLAWPMPLFPEYHDDLKTPFADLKNLGSREGGANTAAHFLSRFVGDAKWAHLDIAGTAWSGRAREYLGKGATGAGVRLLTRFLESL